MQEIPRRRIASQPRDFQSVDKEFGAHGVERGHVGAVEVLDEPVGEEVSEEGVDLALGKTGHDDQCVGEGIEVRSEKNAPVVCFLTYDWLYDGSTEFDTGNGSIQFQIFGSDLISGANPAGSFAEKSNLRKVDMAARSTLLVWKSPSLHRRVALSSSGVEDK